MILLELPIPVLALVTGWLEYEHLLKLFQLCGNKQLWSSMVHLGAVTEVIARSLKSAQLVVPPFGSLPPISRLLRLVIDCPQCYVPLAANWTASLPSTLLEIRFNFTASLDVWLRPITDSEEDFILKTSSELEDYTPISVGSVCPQLELLELRGKRNENHNFYNTPWSNDMRRRFLDSLPHTLTSLHLSNGFYGWELVLPPIPIIQQLVHLGGDFAGLPLLSVLAGAATPPQDPGNSTPDQEISSNQAILPCMESLDLEDMQFTAKLLPLSLLSNLTRLRLVPSTTRSTDGIHLILPSKLTHLDLTCDAELLGMIFTPFPPLHTLILRLNLTLPMLPTLPDSLTEFEVASASSGWLKNAPALPVRLRRLAFINCLEDPMQLELATMTHLTSLAIISNDIPDDKTAKPIEIGRSARTLRLPPSLTHLDLTGHEFQNEEFPALPKALQRVAGQYVVQEEFLIDILRRFDRTTGAMVLQLRFFPQIPIDNIKIDFIFGDAILLRMHRQALTELDFRGLSRTPLAFVSTYSQDTLPKNATLVHGLRNPAIMLPCHLPRTLTELDARDWNIFLPSDASKVDMPPKNDIRLPADDQGMPPNLRVLHANRPTNRGGSIGYFPLELLKTTPKLQKLVFYGTVDVLLHLPSTLTDISFHDMSKDLRLRFSSWPSSLLHLRIELGSLLLSNLKAAISQLQTLYVPYLIISEDQLPPFKEPIEEINPNTLRSHCRRHLLPPQVRTLWEMWYIVSWNADSMAKLPASVKSFVPSILSGPDTDALNRDWQLLRISVGKLLPPSVTKVDLSRWSALRYDAANHFGNLLELRVRADFFDAESLSHLPSTLRVLHLLYFGHFGAQEAAALPRSLHWLRLFNPSSLVKGFAAKLPATLVGLSLTLESGSYPLEDLELLPISLQRLVLSPSPQSPILPRSATLRLFLPLSSSQ